MSLLGPRPLLSAFAPRVSPLHGPLRMVPFGKRAGAHSPCIASMSLWPLTLSASIAACCARGQPPRAVASWKRPARVPRASVAAGAWPLRSGPACTIAPLPGSAGDIWLRPLSFWESLPRPCRPGAVGTDATVVRLPWPAPLRSLVVTTSPWRLRPVCLPKAPGSTRRPSSARGNMTSQARGRPRLPSAAAARAECVRPVLRLAGT